MGLSLLAPILSSYGLTYVSNPIYRIFGFLCHQIPERSFWILENPVAVCARCIGIYAGLMSGALLLPLVEHLFGDRPVRARWIFLALLPMGIDWSLTHFEIWANTGASRFITGLLLGIICGLTITQSLIALRTTRGRGIPRS